ncbi:MAG: hypothetical protein ACKPA7_05845, partial [Sphaerospermopsis kisseleviana]
PTNGSAVTGSSGNTKLLRGGSWDINPESCRSASRVYDGAGFGFFYYGFRVVCGAARTLKPFTFFSYSKRSLKAV